jgi:uncharacterized protein (TIGR02271 family)
MKPPNPNSRDPQMAQMNMTDNATLSALFENREYAEDAVDRLVAAGIPHSSISLTAGAAGDTRTADPDQHKGFFEALADFFMPEEDRYTYAEGLRRGGHLVTVRNLPPALYDEALDILDDDGAVDLDTQEQTWRQEGWEGYRAGAAYEGSQAAARSGAEEVIPVVEEQVRIGKRDVSLGRVRVRSYMHEQPVNEQVELHDERVSVERRPVDRAVGATDRAFEERSIEAEEHSEEAVVDKQARVVEEVSLRRDHDTHTETVSDSVKRTEVEVEDDRASRDRTGSTR